MALHEGPEGEHHLFHGLQEFGLVGVAPSDPGQEGIKGE